MCFARRFRGIFSNWVIERAILGRCMIFIRSAGSTAAFLPEVRRAADAGDNYADQYDINDPLHHIAEGHQDGERDC